ncbi:MAG: ComEC/Rec2 family competence protein [Caldisericaceae bacterium]
MTSFVRFKPFTYDRIPPSLNEKTITVYGNVSGFSEEAYYPKSFTVNNLSIDGKTYSGALKVYTNGSLPPAYSAIKLDGKIVSYNNSSIITNISGSSYYCFATSVQTLSSKDIFVKLSSLREKIISNVMLSMRSDESFLLLSSILGVQSMSQQDKEPYTNTGTAHIFAISGLHIGILGEVLRFFISKITILSPIFVILILLIYLLLIGFKVSAVRAFVMYSFMLISRYVGIPVKSINSLFVSAIIVLLISPSSLFSLSFYLSFAAVFSLLVLPEIIEANFKINNLFRIFIPVVSVQVFTLPIIAAYFHVVTLYSIIANMILIPSLYVVAPIGFIQVLLSAISLKVAKIFAPVVNFTFSAVNFFINAISKLYLSHIYVNFTIPLMAASYALIVLTIVAFSKKRKIFAFVATLLLIAVFLFPIFFARDVRIAKSFDGEDCFLLRENSKTILFFLPNASKTGATYSTFSNFLKQNGVNSIDCIFIGHCVSSEDWSLALSLLEDKNFLVKNAILSDDSALPFKWDGHTYALHNNSTVSYNSFKIQFKEGSSFIISSPSETLAFAPKPGSLSEIAHSSPVEVYMPETSFQSLSNNEKAIYKIVTY